MLQERERYYGLVKFFDYKVNNFGFIGNAKSKNYQIDSDIYVKKENLVHPANQYEENTPVTFFITKNSRGYQATQVEIVKYASIEVQSESLQFFDEYVRIQLTKDLLRDKQYTISKESSDKICNALANVDSAAADKIFFEIDKSRYISRLNKRFPSWSDSEKLNVIAEKEIPELIFNAAKNWRFDDDVTTNNLINLLQKNKIDLDQIKKFYEELVSRLEKLAPIHRLNAAYFFKDDELVSEIITNYRFSSKSDFQLLLDWINAKYEQTEKIPRIKEFVLALRSQISVICDDIRLEYLSKFKKAPFFTEILNHWQFEHLGLLSDLPKILSQREIDYTALTPFKNKLISKFPNITTEEQLNWYQIFSHKDLFVLILYENISGNPENFYSAFSLISQKTIYTELVFQLYAERGNLRHNEKQILSFWAVILGFEEFPDIKCINSFFESYPKYLQSFFVKFIFQQIYFGKNYTQNPLTYLKSINYSDINAQLIITFITHCEQPFEIMKAKINHVFKSTFNNVENIEDDLRIRELTKPCNGRAKYAGEIFYDPARQTFSFSGAFWISKGFYENIFCEGRFWKEKSFFMLNQNRYTQKKYPMYWCRGDTCCEPNILPDLNLPVQDWTLYEISEVLKIKIDRKYYSLLAGWANRMNEIILRLYCRECHSILRPEPFNPSLLGFYAVPLFKCVNENCALHNQIIRIAHCLNGNCSGENNRIIDSRDCPKCSKGWLVCQDCYACCPEHHDKKMISCARCGSAMEFRQDNWYCKKPDCNSELPDEKILQLKKFWSRTVTYFDKTVDKT